MLRSAASRSLRLGRRRRTNPSQRCYSASAAASFVTLDADGHFPLQNLPYGVVSPADGGSPRAVVRIGDHVRPPLPHPVIHRAFSAPAPAAPSALGASR